VKICVIGKFPPIQGGVSTRTYWTAHGLAARGHEVHVVTNAKEVRAPFRMYMRARDWDRCEAVCGNGSVTVHWTDPVDSSQSYIPMASPFVSKLTGVAARVHSENAFDVVYSHYIEPYGVAGHLAAQIAGVPHVVRMAGSDAGRLWHHPQFEALYDHVLRTAEVVIAAGTIAERAHQRGVAPDRIAVGGSFALPENLFTRDGPTLDLPKLRVEIQSDPDFRDLQWGEFEGNRPYFGIYGKLGESKGSFALLGALHRLKQDGLEVGLVALAHGGQEVERDFRSRASACGLADRIHQIPFLPHWRVPEFLRGCLAVCCLEQDFPIAFHAPIVPREVLLCGACLVGSTEVIRKLSAHERTVHGYNCVAIEDVTDLDTLSARLAAIVRDPEPVATVGARGGAIAREMQSGVPFVQTLECMFEAAIARQRVSRAMRWSADDAKPEASSDRFQLTRIARAALDDSRRTSGPALPPAPEFDCAQAPELLAAIERTIAEGKAGLRSLLPAVRIEIAIAKAEDESEDSSPNGSVDALFRLRMRRWAMAEGDLATLVPVRDPLLRILEFDYDVSDFMAARTAAEFPSVPLARRSYIVAFGGSDRGRQDPLLVDGLTAQILELSDGTRTAADIARHLVSQSDRSAMREKLNWIENLFVRGLIGLQDARVEGAVNSVRDGVLRRICLFPRTDHVR
jgi:glycosyltransferase involved in cell wall biosynthesis